MFPRSSTLSRMSLHTEKQMQSLCIYMFVEYMVIDNVENIIWKTALTILFSILFVMRTNYVRDKYSDWE